MPNSWHKILDHLINVPEVVMTHNRRLIPVTKWSQYHDYPTEPGLRWLIFNGEKNGFSEVIRRVGRRVLIDEQSFFDWVDGNDGRSEP